MSWGAVFPGQGSQCQGMGRFLFDNFKLARLYFEEASDILNLDLKKLCFSGSDEDLRLTQNTQPALLLVSVISYEVLKEVAGFKPIASSGHSIGEYAALVCANSIRFTDAMKAVRVRGIAMQEAAPIGEGSMCAVMGMTNSQARELCNWVENQSKFRPLEPANFNSPGQIVISGSTKAINWMIENFKKEALSDPPARAKFIPLNVSAPFHCSLMKPAEEKMQKILNEMSFADAEYSIVQNFTAEAIIEKTKLRENLIRQISAPVLWADCVLELRAQGVQKVIEVGSGRVLSGLIKKIDGEHFSTFTLNSLEELRMIEHEINL